MPAAAAVKRSRASASTALMFGACFVTNVAVSIVAPMLPKHLDERRLLPPGSAAGAVRGLLFCCAPVVNLVMTQFGPAIARAVGHISMCAGGLMLFAASLASFGSSCTLSTMLMDPTGLSDASSTGVAAFPQMELALMFVFRMFAAAGGSLAMLSSTSLALEANPDLKGTLMGASETAIGVGFAVGPSIGAAFYTAGGFAAPFGATAVAGLGMLPLVALARGGGRERGDGTSPEDEKHDACLSPWRCPSALSVSLIGVASMLAIGFMDPTLAPYEAQILGADTAGAGVLFSAASFPYALLGTVVGSVVDRAPGYGALLLCSGGALTGTALMLLPAYAWWMATWSWQLSVLMTMGVSTAFGMVPAVPVVVRIMEEEAKGTAARAPSEDDVLSLVYSSFSAGELLGPLIGAWSAQSFGFTASAFSIGAAVVLISVLATVLLAASNHLHFTASIPALGEGSSPLLGDNDAMVPVHSDNPRSLGVARAISRELHLHSPRSHGDKSPEQAAPPTSP